MVNYEAAFHSSTHLTAAIRAMLQTNDLMPPSGRAGIFTTALAPTATGNVTCSHTALRFAYYDRYHPICSVLCTPNSAACLHVALHNTEAANVSHVL